MGKVRNGRSTWIRNLTEADVVPALPMEEENPLELEHMMGIAGDGKNSVQFHPTEPNVMVSYTGRHVIISNTKDPHQQEFLRGHNEEITMLALSPMGNMIASGQGSSTRVPNSEAMVIVWDYKTRMPGTLGMPSQGLPPSLRLTRSLATSSQCTDLWSCMMASRSRAIE